MARLRLTLIVFITLVLLLLLVVVVTTTFRQAANSASNFQILLGTDNVLQWWFYIFVPISWLLLSARVLENFSEDIKKLKSGAPLLEQSAIGSE